MYFHFGEINEFYGLLIFKNLPRKGQMINNFIV